MSCINQYCWISGKTTGQHTNTGCSCLKVLPLEDQLALKKRIMTLEGNRKFTAEDVRHVSLKILSILKEFETNEKRYTHIIESAFVLLYDRLLSEEKKR